MRDAIRAAFKIGASHVTNIDLIGLLIYISIDKN
jgi:hypothetical protein